MSLSWYARLDENVELDIITIVRKSIRSMFFGWAFR